MKMGIYKIAFVTSLLSNIIVGNKELAINLEVQFL